MPESNEDAQGIAARVKKLIAEHLCVPPSDVTRFSLLEVDLGADSLDLIEMVMSAEEAFNVEITNDEAEAVETVGDAIRLIERLTA